MHDVCVCSSAIVQHVRRVHPEVADGTSETEDDDPDHSYFNTKLDLPPQRPATPPPLPLRRPPPPSHFTRNLMSRRGRRKTALTPAVNYYSREDRYVTTVDRRERRNQMRMEKEVEDRVKQLRRLTCARSRSIDEHRTMGRGEILSLRQSYQSEAGDDGTEVSGVADVTMSSPAHDSYPYLDHSYFSREPDPGSDRSQTLWKTGMGRCGPPASMASDVSAFQECETMLLGLPSSGRGKGRRGRGRGRGRGGWTIASRHSGLAAAAGDDMDTIDPAIRDLDLLAESELLLRPAGDYSILQDILGPNCISTSHPTPVSTSLRQVTSPMKSPGPVPSRMTREPTRSSLASDGGLNDSLSLDEASVAGPSDLDDIELCEDDYRLFDPEGAASHDQHQSTASSAAMRVWKNGAESTNDAVTLFSAQDGAIHDQRQTATSSAAASSWKNGLESGNNLVRQFEVESGNYDIKEEFETDGEEKELARQQLNSDASLSAENFTHDDVKKFEADDKEKDRSRQRQNSVPVDEVSLSADDFDDETRSATSEPACTSFDTETDHASIPHDDNEDEVDVDVDSDAVDGRENDS